MQVDTSGAVRINVHTVETWCVTQQVVALSSAESEFYAMGSGCHRGLTVKSVLQEIVDLRTPGEKVEMRVFTDSDAARGMIHRQGVGRVRHLATRYLWHQDALRRGDFTVHRVPSKQNPVDVGTKVVDAEILWRCMDDLRILTRAKAGFQPLVVLMLCAPGAEGAGSEEGLTIEGSLCMKISTVAGLVSWASTVFAILVGFAVLFRKELLQMATRRRTSKMDMPCRAAEAVETADSETQTWGGIDVVRGGDIIADPDAYMGQLCGTSDLREVNADRWVRNVSVQAQTAYMRWRAVPRFHPLPDRDHGCWPEQPEPVTVKMEGFEACG